MERCRFFSQFLEQDGWCFRNFLSLARVYTHETKLMNEISKAFGTIWLRTDRPVVPMSAAAWNHLPVIQNSLHEGIFAVRDFKRPEFFELEIDGYWYYIHIPSSIGGVYLIAARPKSYEMPELRLVEALSASA